MTVADPTPAAGLRLVLVAAATGLRLAVSEDQERRLLAYVALLHRWNGVHNLSSAHDASTLLQHVVDCLAIVNPLRRQFGAREVRMLDAGTGGGLPAIVLSIMLPKWKVAAVDAVGKKVAFVRQVAGELGLGNLRPIHARLEGLDSPINDLIVCRAFSSLRQLVDQTRQLLAPDGMWAAMKGKLPDGEVRELPADCQLFHVEPLEVPGLEADRCLMWLKRHGIEGNR